MVILSACTTGNCNNIPRLKLIEMPLGGDKVASELKKYCDDTRCPNTNNWFNKLKEFREAYMKVYRDEIMK